MRILSWSVLMSLLVCAPVASAATIKISADPDLCGDLLEAADEHAAASRQLGLRAADTVSAGEGDLKEETCFSSLQDLDFNFFTASGSMMSAVIGKVRDQAVKMLMDMTCDIANTMAQAADKTLSCSATVGVNLSGGFGSLPSVSVEECGGLGDLNYELDGRLGEGNYGINESYGAGSNLQGDGSESDGAESGNGYF